MDLKRNSGANINSDRTWTITIISITYQQLIHFAVHLSQIKTLIKCLDSSHDITP